jgi:UDP-N-acetylmuramoyl-L-alanyl-D-glutamate--2,6-diaminopimelate ligase
MSNPITWHQALAGVDTLERIGEAHVTGVQYDSRRVLPGDVFVAMKGGTVDGNRFIEAALARGAAAIVTDSRESFESLRPRTPAALVEHGRRALATVSANIFDHPERKLAVSAVTGTNGKTTTAYLLEQMLKHAGRTCILLGTIETHIGNQVLASEHTTPEARDLYKIFADGVAAGATECVMEMSSHALHQERVWGIPVDVAMFTNLTQDHLDYHQTMGAYFAAKTRLFEGVGARAPRVAVINADDEYTYSQLRHRIRQAGSELMSYGMMDYGTHRATAITLEAGKTSFEFVTPSGTISMQSPLTGRVNVYNLLAASCAALARGLTLEQIAAATQHLGQVPGRFQVVPSGTTGITVVVDYAHTDDALRNLIALAGELVHETKGRVITLFGCGGDRDRTKRPKMGRAAAEGSDLVVVTSDNPRSEDPTAIIEEILPAIRATTTDCIVEEDRAGAIAIAIRAARPGDIVLLAGKGHEKTQTFADGPVPFDDVAVAADILKELA